MEPAHIRDAKRELRRQIRARLQHLTPGERAAASAQARSLLERQTVWQQAQSILFFAPLPEELDIWPLVQAALAAEKTAALPRFTVEANGYAAGEIKYLAGDLRPGRFGIREPGEHCRAIPPKRLDFVLAPGVAFDLRGRRLGRGKGFYDRLLALVRGTICGVAFDEQIVGEIPVAPHDVGVNCILTPTRWIEL